MSRDRPGGTRVPKNAAAAYQAGLATFEQGRYAEAVEMLSAIAEGASLPATLARFYLGQAHLQLGIGEFRLGHYASAAKHFTAARALNPGSADLSRYLLACHVGRGRFDKAAEELERVRDAGADDDALPIRLAHALARDGQHDRAVETLENATHVAPQRADLRFQLGLLHAAVGDFDRAVTVLDQAAGLAPLDVEIRQHLGLALAARGDASQAVEHLSVAQKLRPNDAYIGLLLTLAAKAATGAGHEVSVDAASAGPASVDPDAIETLGRIIIEEPDFVEAFLSLPTSQVDAEVFSMLAGVLERALECHPDYADLHFHCSRVYSRLGRTESAVAEADRAVEINPRYVQALIQLGRLYAEMDLSAKAIDRLRAAVEFGGDYPDVHFMLAELHRKDGRRESARAEYRRALALNANYDSARRALEALVSA